MVSWDGRTADEWAAQWQVPGVVLFERTTSTNDRARELAENSAAAFTVVLADEQTAGRGQHGRAWLTGAGSSILLSVILRVNPLPAPQLLPLRIGLAVARALEALGSLDVQLKWPNDVLIKDRKVGGILCEGTASSAGTVVAAGIGLNVHQQHDDWPSALRETATSVVQYAPHITRGALVGAILDELRISPTSSALLSPEELAAWHKRDLLHGRTVRVDGQNRGIAIGIAADGALRIRTTSDVLLIRSGSVRLDDGIS